MVVSNSFVSEWWGSAHLGEKLPGFYLDIQSQKVPFDSVGGCECDVLGLDCLLQGMRRWGLG